MDTVNNRIMFEGETHIFIISSCYLKNNHLLLFYFLKSVNVDSIQVVE